jgi:hypothetical protein
MEKEKMERLEELWRSLLLVNGLKFPTSTSVFGRYQTRNVPEAEEINEDDKILEDLREGL